LGAGDKRTAGEDPATMRRWRRTPGWRRMKSVVSRPKRNSSAKLECRKKPQTGAPPSDQPIPSRTQLQSIRKAHLSRRMASFRPTIHMAAVRLRRQIIVRRTNYAVRPTIGPAVPPESRPSSPISAASRSSLRGLRPCSESSRRSNHTASTASRRLGRAKHPYSKRTKNRMTVDPTYSKEDRLRAAFETPYRLRKASGGTGFGQINRHAASAILLRGVRESACRWALICTTHNPPEAVHPPQWSA